MLIPMKQEFALKPPEVDLSNVVSTIDVVETVRISSRKTNDMKLQLHRMRKRAVYAYSYSTYCKLLDGERFVFG